MAKETRFTDDISGEDEDVETWVIGKKDGSETYEIDLSGPMHGPSGRRPATLKQIAEKGRPVIQTDSLSVKDASIRSLTARIRD